jgi:hypothetical protein
MRPSGKLPEPPDEFHVFGRPVPKQSKTRHETREAARPGKLPAFLKFSLFAVEGLIRVAHGSR